MIAQLNKTYLRTRPTKIWSRLISYGLFEGRPVTTRGQWINPFVFSFYKLWKVLPQGREVKNPIFIIGTGRSGTTLLGTVLSLHHTISFLNEPKALWHEIFSEEDLIGSYSRGKAHYFLNESDVNELVKYNAKKLFGAYLTVSRGTRVLDKYTELLFRIPFVMEIFPDAKFLFITRNGKNTVQSINNWTVRLGKNKKEETHDWWGVNNRKWKLLCNQVVPQSELLSGKLREIQKMENQIDRATVEWIVTMEEGIRMIEQYPNSILRLKYEKFLTDPVSTITEIKDFSDLDYDDKVVQYAKAVIGKPEPKKTIEINPILKPIFGKLMLNLGYEV